MIDSNTLLRWTAAATLICAAFGCGPNSGPPSDAAEDDSTGLPTPGSTEDSGTTSTGLPDESSSGASSSSTTTTVTTASDDGEPPPQLCDYVDDPPDPIFNLDRAFVRTGFQDSWELHLYGEPGVDEWSLVFELGSEIPAVGIYEDVSFYAMECAGHDPTGGTCWETDGFAQLEVLSVDDDCFAGVASSFTPQLQAAAAGGFVAEIED